MATDPILVPATCPHCGASIHVKATSAALRAAAERTGGAKATRANPRAVSPKRKSGR